MTGSGQIRGRARTGLRAALLAVLVCLPAAGASAQDAPEAPTLRALALKDRDSVGSCREAALHVAETSGVPAALLIAIARNETAKRTAGGVSLTAWPWTLHAQGTGYHFDEKADAVATLRRLHAEGVRSVDVGCMQINLFHHPDAFASAEEALDPVANVAYGAAYLARLKDRYGSWRAAIQRYHSADPDRFIPYEARVSALLSEERSHLSACASGPAGEAPVTVAGLACLRNPVLKAALRQGSPGGPADAGARTEAPITLAAAPAGRPLLRLVSLDPTNSL
ncbi:MAG: transglycosylase SLT domain-containing protein [Alphaproteobacteria bacterium]|nr:transglycosylase SLT domain-containing protein [Alphaproteobacteria bacterium]